MESAEISAMIDHTFLKPAGEANAVKKLCREAKKYGFASVCVNPAEVPLAAKLLKKSTVKVCTVIGFPLGQDSAYVKCFSALDAVRMGAQELDFVINQRLLKADPEACLDELKLIVATCKDVPNTLGKPVPLTKLIIECCNLTDDEKVLACKLAKQAGFDFVKTSTGFASGGATVADVKLMRKTVGKKMGVKAAGGIHTREEAEAMVKAGATRLGCSAGVAIVQGKKK